MSRCKKDTDRTRLLYFFFNDDGEHGISPEELTSGIRNKLNILVPTKTCVALFNHIDTDNSGFITLCELKDFLFKGEERGVELTSTPTFSLTPTWTGREAMSPLHRSHLQTGTNFS